MADNKKDIHIVFQILNFLSFPSHSQLYDLSADEKLLLIFLAKHKGHKGIYPSLTTLSKELHRSVCAVRRSLNRLDDKKLIHIEYNSGKSSNYTLLIPFLDLSPTPSVHARGDENIPLASTLGHPSRPREDTPSVHARQSDKKNNQKEIIQRGRKKRAPLSPSFEPIKSLEPLIAETASKSGKNADQLLAKFKNIQKSKDGMSLDWNAEYENFLLNERPMGYLNGGSVNARGHSDPRNGETKSTVLFFDDPRHPNYEDYKRSREEKLAKEKLELEQSKEPQEHISFMERKRRYELNLNQHGELPNGNISSNNGRRRDS